MIGYTGSSRKKINNKYKWGEVKRKFDENIKQYEDNIENNVNVELLYKDIIKEIHTAYIILNIRNGIILTTSNQNYTAKKQIATLHKINNSYKELYLTGIHQDREVLEGYIHIIALNLVDIIDIMSLLNDTISGSNYIGWEDGKKIYGIEYVKLFQYELFEKYDKNWFSIKGSIISFEILDIEHNPYTKGKHLDLGRNQANYILSYRDGYEDEKIGFMYLYKKYKQFISMKYMPSEEEILYLLYFRISEILKNKLDLDMVEVIKPCFKKIFNISIGKPKIERLRFGNILIFYNGGSFKTLNLKETNVKKGIEYSFSKNTIKINNDNFYGTTLYINKEISNQAHLDNFINLSLYFKKNISKS